MGRENEKSKMLIVGATRYLGQYMVKACVSMGHPTYAYVRPIQSSTEDPVSASKLKVHQEFEALGVTIFQGQLEEHEKLVSALKRVDVVISTLVVPQHLDQLKIVDAIKEASNIKRFIPSEYGNEVDRSSGLPPFEALLANKRRIRRAVEAAGISYTFISGNSFAAYFIHLLLQPHDLHCQVTVYGSGEANAVLNYEEDVAAYTVRAATDPRAANRVVIIRPLNNIVTQSDLISSWEKKTGRTRNKLHVSEDEIVKLSQTLPFPENIPPAILHNIFVKGEQMSFQLTEHDLEASRLYPDHNYTSVDAVLDSCLVNPGPKPKLAVFS